ncbi:MAG: hypothetical protein IJF92_00180 [Bacilli bacterium]|nr:hypothetical protein [Bacilli bacterium]MBQ3307593.1 hypothetical protein [Bacilli bacterium]
MPLFTNYGKPKATIANYMKDIEQRYIPALNNQLGTNINNYPKMTRETYAVYEDSDNGIDLEISSNNRNIQNRGELYVAVSYDHMKEDVGIVNLNDVEDAVNVTQYSLQELGFKTPEDIEKERQEAELKKQQDEEAKKKAAEDAAKRKEELRKQAELQKQTQDEEPEEEEPEEDNYDEDRTDYVEDLDNKLKYVSKIGEGAKVELEWLALPDSDKTTREFVHIEMHFTCVSGENFLVETQKIKPKIETICNTQECINYANKVSDKLRITPQIVMKDDKGKEIKLPQNLADEDFEDDDFVLDI